MEKTKKKEEQEYAIFNKTQKINSDFDKFCKSTLEKKNI